MTRSTRSSAPGAREQLTEYRRKRDFAKTPEPSGDEAKPKPRAGKKKRATKQARTKAGTLQFVIQKHAASHLHFDLRLELDGVMKSWAVPKGPHADPSVKRLAMQVEDHPMGYNTFEGTIPKGEYGGGTVMLWDRGTYTADEVKPGADEQAALRSGYGAGKLSVTFHGERMRGSWALVRTDRGPKPKWLFFKHTDRWARADGDLVAEHTTSVATGRTMNEIAAERDRVWRSNRGGSRGGEEAGPGASAAADDAVRPMLPQPARKLPDDGRVFEAWPGGERALAYVTPAGCALVNEKGRDVSARYPDLADALAGLGKRAKTGFVLDAEITGEGAQARLHVLDILLHGEDALAARPWRERRAALEELFRNRRLAGVKPVPVDEDGEKLLQRAGREGWSGVFARDPGSPYLPGKRTAQWQRIATPAKYR